MLAFDAVLYCVLTLYLDQVVSHATIPRRDAFGVCYMLCWGTGEAHPNAVAS